MQLLYFAVLVFAIGQATSFHIHKPEIRDVEEIDNIRALSARKRCWPKATRALVVLVTMVINEQPEVQESNPHSVVQQFRGALSLIGNAVSLNMFTKGGIQRFMCQMHGAGSVKAFVDGLDITDSERTVVYHRLAWVVGKSAGGIEGFVHQGKTHERFFRYLMNNNLPRDPPIHDIDKAELLTEVRAFIEGTGFQHRIDNIDNIINMVETFIESDSIEAAAETLDIPQSVLEDRMLFPMKEQFPVMLEMIRLMLRFMQTLAATGALDEIQQM